MNKNVAEIVNQTVSLINLEAYLKKAKIKPENEDAVEKVLDFIQYEVMRSVKDLIVMERL